jgi:septation ring formation regulator EzrA
VDDRAASAGVLVPARVSGWTEGSPRDLLSQRRLSFPAIIDTISEQLRTYEQQTGQTAWDFAPQLLEDVRFIEQLIEFANPFRS